MPSRSFEACSAIASWDRWAGWNIYFDVTDILASDNRTADAIVRSAASGDEVAFARLVDEHHSSMARVAFVICGDADIARDAVQVAWSIAWRRIGTLREPGQIRAWLVAIAANEARKARKRRRQILVVEISEQSPRSNGGDPVEMLDVADLEIALRGLKPEDRSLLAMRYAAGLDSGEIAQQLGISASGVRSRLARVLDRLRMDLISTTETSDG